MHTNQPYDPPPPSRPTSVSRPRLGSRDAPSRPLAAAPPRKTRFGGPLALSKVHWVRPVLVAEITYLTWSEDGLLRHTVFVGLREDKPAKEVRREAPTTVGTENR